MHNHVFNYDCGSFCPEYGNIYPSEGYLIPDESERFFDPEGEPVKTVFETWSGRQVVRDDCNPDSFAFERTNIISYESTIHKGRIVYVHDVKVWWTE